MGTVLEHERLRVWMDGEGIAHVAIIGTGGITGPDVAQLLDDIASLGAGRRLPLIADIRQLRSVTPKTRQIMSSDRAGDLICAAAALVSSPLTRMIGQFFLRLNRPPFPMQLFYDDDEAAVWARGFIEDAPRS